MNRFCYSLSSCFLLAILTAGCVSRWPTTITFKPNGNGPLSSIKPLTVLIQVEDQRPPEEQDSVVNRTALIGGTDIWYTKKPVPLIVQEALISEFSKCGQRVVTDTSAPIDARVKIVLKRFRAFYSEAGALSGAGVSVEAQVDAEVAVTNEARKATVPSLQISGDYQRKGLHSVGHPEKALNEALAEFIHNLTFDSRLVEGLQ
jgi:uncharacterized lipoprotein YajG